VLRHYESIPPHFRLGFVQELLVAVSPVGSATTGVIMASIVARVWPVACDLIVVDSVHSQLIHYAVSHIRHLLLPVIGRRADLH
jgi:hypothetical protein